MLGRTMSLEWAGRGRLGTAAALVILFGLSAGWAGHQIKAGKVAKPWPGDEVASSADRIKTDFWKTFGEKGAIVMIGDSHTDYADWPAMFPGARIVNRGVAGDTTRSVMARLDTILSVSAATAFVMLGTNDILRGRPQDEVRATYHALLDRLIDHGLRVVVTSTPLTTARKTNAQIADLNADIQDYCGQHRCSFVDLNAAIGSDGVLDPAMTVDGIHLNGAGYARWAAALAPYIRTEVGASR